MAEVSAAGARNALSAIAVVVVGAAAHWMRDVITPLLLALFVAIMVDALARMLRRRVTRLPAGWAVGIALAIGALGFGLSLYVVASYAGDFIDQVSGYGDRLNGLVDKIA